MRAFNGLIVTGVGAHASGQDFKVSSDGSSNVFFAESTNGDTNIQGTTTVGSLATFGGLEVTGGIVHINGADFKVSNSGLDKFTIAASSGNTVCEGSSLLHLT